MADRRGLRRSFPSDFTAVLPHVRVAGLVFFAAAPLLLIAAAVPRTLFLPSVSLAAITVAAAASVAAWLFGARRNSNSVTLWDIAGATALIGCAAAMLSEPESILQTLGRR